jgi:hypothetical protein
MRDAGATYVSVRLGDKFRLFAEVRFHVDAIGGAVIVTKSEFAN